MNKTLTKILLELITYEIIFLLIQRIALIIIPHESQEIIYFVNINLHFLTACLIWMGLRLTKVNREIVIFFGVLTTFTLLYSLLFIFSDTNFPETFNVINYHILHSIGTTFQLSITFFLFFSSISPRRFSRFILRLSIFFAIIIGSGVYIHFLLNTDYSQWEPLFQRAYYLNILNFSLLIVFWHQYTTNKIILSEYLSTILSVYTIFIGIEIFHFFSYQNDMIFHHISQYFYVLLYFMMMIVWLLRLKYLNSAESKSNEEYIKNYYVLHGIISKPRQGLLVEFYSNINKSFIIAFVMIMIFIGVFLFFFDKFEIFVKLNLLLLLLAGIISIILAIVTWHRRWYDAVGFLFKNKKRERKP